MRVFISYAREDMLLCDTVIRELETIDEVDVDRDVTHPEPGMPIPDRIREQMRSCDLFIVLLTPNSVNSKWVTTEIAWAGQMQKRIVPVVQAGVSSGDVPALRADLEHIIYDPADYTPALVKLHALLARLQDETPADSTGSEKATGRTAGIPLVHRLTTDDIRNLLSLGSTDMARMLEQRLVQNARATVQDFFTDPRYGSFVNVGTLRTDANVLIMRWDTVHTLLRAAHEGTRTAFRRAGYEAGILYGVGLIRWFLERTTETEKGAGLPRDSLGLLKACSRIDVASGWGQIDVVRVSKSSTGFGWHGTISIRDHFLAHEVCEIRSRHSERRYSEYVVFWKAYIESTFSAALASWYGIWTSEGGEEEVPFFVAECEDGGDPPGNDLVFDIRICSPLYDRTRMNLQRELFCPYIRRAATHVIARARGVIEGFVRELAGVEESAQEDMKQALTWLGQNVGDEAKEAAAALQKARNVLHGFVHAVDTAPTEAESRSVLRSCGSAVLMACRDIRLEEHMKAELRRQLLSQSDQK